MTQLRIAFSLVLVFSCVWTANCYGQARKDTEVVGIAAVLDECPLTARSEFDADEPVRPVEMAPIVATFLAGVAGDLAAAGVNALGAALEEASREKGFSAVASTSFAFYQVAIESDDIGKSVKFSPRLKRRHSLCLVSALTMAPASSEKPSSWASEISANHLRAAGLQVLDGNGFPLDPDFYIEMVLQLRDDGFVVRPGLVWYRRPFANAPKRPLPAELHVAFSVPASPSAEANATFGLARIRLPAIAPGEIWKAPMLRSYTSLVMPVRPSTGSPDATKADFTSVIADAKANREEIATLERLLARARRAVSAQGATKDDQSKVESLEDRLIEAKGKASRINQKETNVIDRGVVPTGSTNVQARFTVVRDANQFGLAVARSLQGRSKALGETVTAQLLPETRAGAWTAADTNYVTTMSTVEAAQRTLDDAMRKGDAEAIFAAQLALKNAKAAANAAAAASDRVLPFPNLL